MLDMHSERVATSVASDLFSASVPENSIWKRFVWVATIIITAKCLLHNILDGFWHRNPFHSASEFFRSLIIVWEIDISQIFHRRHVGTDDIFPLVGIWCCFVQIKSKLTQWALWTTIDSWTCSRSAIDPVKTIFDPWEHHVF